MTRPIASIIEVADPTPHAAGHSSFLYTVGLHTPDGSPLKHEKIDGDDYFNGVSFNELRNEAIAAYGIEPGPK